jgi:hypothetical protein
MPDGDQLWAIPYRGTYVPLGDIIIDGEAIETKGMEGDPAAILSSIPIEDIEYLYVGRFGIAIGTKRHGSGVHDAIAVSLSGYHSTPTFQRSAAIDQSLIAGDTQSGITLFWDGSVDIADGVASRYFFKPAFVNKVLVKVQGMIGSDPVSFVKTLGD